MCITLVEHLTQIFIPIPGTVAVQGITATDTDSVEERVSLDQPTYLEKRGLKPVFVLIIIRFVKRRDRYDFNATILDEFHTGLDQLIPRICIASVVVIARSSIRKFIESSSIIAVDIRLRNPSKFEVRNASL